MENLFNDIKPIDHYIRHPQDIPLGDTPEELYIHYFILENLCDYSSLMWGRNEFVDFLKSFSKDELINFLKSLPKEDRNALLVGRVDCWIEAGIKEYLMEVLNELQCQMNIRNRERGHI